MDAAHLQKDNNNNNNIMTMSVFGLYVCVLSNRAWYLVLHGDAKQPVGTLHHFSPV